MANKHYTGTNTPQIKQLYPEWLYPDWMPWWEYREYKAAKFKYRDIIEPLLRETQAKNPALPYVKFIIEEL